MSLKRCEYCVDLLVNPGHAFFDGSGVVAGLSELARHGLVHLRVRSGGPFDPAFRSVVCFEASKRDTGARKRIVVDVSDHGTVVSKPLLEYADVYFKRSFSSEFLAIAVPQTLRSKLQPYGLNLACLGMRASVTHLLVAARLFARRLSGPASQPLLPALSKFAFQARMVVGLPGSRAYEATTVGIRQPTVLLQTRVWPPEPSTEDLRAFNEDRLSLVCALRRAFGERFVGGIVADEYSESTCPPEVLVRGHTRRSAYIKRVKSASVGVYVRGLHNAIAIKMAEYMAAGLCIVSEPLKFELPVPLIEGIHYLAYRSPEECVRHCEWLLAHEQEAAQMRSANITYYRQWVAPDAHVRDLLDRAFAGA